MRPLAAMTSHALLSTVAAAALAAVLAGPVAASPALLPADLALAAAARSDETVVLKRLPAGKEELTFRGEGATRSFTLTLGRAEAARTSTFQLALLNAVSVLPDRSSIKVTINGIVVATLPAASADRAGIVPVKIPAGVLVPGLNTVQVSVALLHRVDCSIKATYELWAALDPAQTGFVVPREAAFGTRTLDDLAADPLAEDGTTRIHLRMEEGADPVHIGEAARLIDALVRRAGLARPIVDMGPALGQGAGFDVMLDTGPRGEAVRGLRVVGTSEGVTIGRDTATERLVLVLPGADDDALDRSIAALDRPPAAGTHAGAPLEGGESKTLAELGFSTDNFAGRHYLSSVGIDLPADFYQANDRARLLVDGAHAASLIDGSELVFRVNGTLVSTLPLAAGKAERFQHEVVELPLRFFHPGHNELSIEGMTSASLDQQCDVVAMPREARLTILGSSEIEMPNFAHLVTLPQIPSALAYDSAPDGGPVHLYLPDGDRGSIGAGLTVLANMAATQGEVGSPVVHLDGPTPADPPGILIAPADRLPEAVTATLRRVSAPVDDPAPDAAAPGPDRAAVVSPPLDASASLNRAALDARFGSAVATAEALLRSRGFFFAVDDRAERLPATSSSMLVAAVAPEANVATVGGVELPRFVQDPAHWLVFTGASAAAYETGIPRLVGTGQWNRLGGQAVSLDLRTDEVRSVQPSRVTYVVPGRLVLTDVRPIFGGIVSNNIVLSIGVLLILMSILGVSTHVLIRRMGAK